MIEAERYKRVARVAALDLEDVVTSYIFGSLKYLPHHRGLGRLVNRALGSPGETCEVRFWPGRDGVEPDVVLAATGWTILIEAKTFSGFERTQLRREWRYLLQEVEQHGASHRIALVTVTHDRYSRDEIRRLIHAAEQPPLSREPTDEEVVTLTWPELLEELWRDRKDDAPETTALLADLELVLERRGLLVPPFSGWPVPSDSWAPTLFYTPGE